MTAAARPITLPTEPLRDGQTVLRPWRDADVAPLVAIAQDPAIVRWVGVPSPYGPGDARAYLAMRRETARVGLSAGFAVTDAGDTLLGAIALMRFSWTDRRAEVGYWLGPGARGAGHSTRAVRLMCGWGIRALGLERIDCLVASGNEPSQRVAQRAGFTREALLRSYMAVAGGGRDDMVCFGLLAGEP